MGTRWLPRNPDTGLEHAIECALKQLFIHLDLRKIIPLQSCEKRMGEQHKHLLFGLLLLWLLTTRPAPSVFLGQARTLLKDLIATPCLHFVFGDVHLNADSILPFLADGALPLGPPCCQLTKKEAPEHPAAGATEHRKHCQLLITSQQCTASTRTRRQGVCPSSLFTHIIKNLNPGKSGHVHTNLQDHATLCCSSCFVANTKRKASLGSNLNAVSSCRSSATFSTALLSEGQASCSHRQLSQVHGTLSYPPVWALASHVLCYFRVYARHLRPEKHLQPRQLGARK